MLIASLIISVATIILAIVNLYIGRQLMNIYRLTKAETQKMNKINQEITLRHEALEAFKKDFSAYVKERSIYHFWPSDN